MGAGSLRGPPCLCTGPVTFIYALRFVRLILCSVYVLAIGRSVPQLLGSALGEGSPGDDALQGVVAVVFRFFPVC